MASTGQPGHHIRRDKQRWRRILPRPTVRIRLTALYGALFAGVGGLALAIIYWVGRERFIASFSLSELRLKKLVAEPHSEGTGSDFKPVDPPQAEPYPHPEEPDLALAVEDNVLGAAQRIRDDALHQLLTVSGLSLVLLTVLAVLLGWYVTGRTLRPLHRITAKARQLSEKDLHQRIALAGPDDELKELADTFDELLARLQAAFDSQRRFIANASHELRTPLTMQRAALQIDLPEAAPDDIPAIAARLLAVNRHTEHLIDGLLALARSERGLGERVPVDLGVTARDVVDQLSTEAAAAHVAVALSAEAGTVLGDPVLLHQLLANLVQNGIRHNHPGGHVGVTIGGDGRIGVRNTGPVVPADRIPELFEPFRQMTADRTASTTGAGLGLSIVRAIAAAHAGSVTARPNPGGGLAVDAWIPVDAGPVADPRRAGGRRTALAES
ncbi:sensor histidine kinase [Streptomyces sp. KR80]|uniref:sensor histidine kinase n=1 Tax=Streptomyces sp. KR80 TaxID=3457426 RepID=UPI003FD64EDA